MRSKGEVVAQGLAIYARLFRDSASLPVTIVPEDVKAYLHALEGLDDVDVLEKAMARAERSSAYFPKPWQIIAAYEAIREARATGVCSQCEGAGYVAGAKGLVECPRCTPGGGRDGKSR